MTDSPYAEAWIPPPPPTPPAAPSPAPKRRTGLIAGAIVLVVVLVAGLAVFTFTRSDTAHARPLALAFTEGQHTTYQIHQTMDARVSSDLFGDQPMTMDVTEVVGWEVASVDQDGVATIQVTVSDMNGTVNGQALPSTPLPPLEIVVAPDGRIVSAGGLSLGGADQTLGFGFPGMGQLTPILPDPGNPIAVGDSWGKEFSQEFPFGEGTIEFTASSTYDRNETVGGREAAVITTRFDVPLDLTMNMADLIDALADRIGGSTGPSDIGLLRDATIAYGGQGTISQTSWVDLQAKELLRMQGRGDFDVALRFSNFPGTQLGSVEMAFTGTFTQELERL